MVPNFSQPLILDVFKARAVRDVKDEENTVAALVEIPRDRTERLLACCIPNLQLHVGLLAHNHTKIAKFDSNSDSVLLFKSLTRQSFQDACLSNSCIP